MSTEQPLALCSALETVDKRVPSEVWEQIFNRLYPSQLSRISIVNKTFNAIVSSLSLWSRMFTIAYGPKMRLRTLLNMPESKSFMLYMCVNSRYVCERCFTVTPFNDDYGRPRPSRAPLPTLSTREFQYLGEELNLGWRVNACHSCRESWSNRDFQYHGIKNQKTNERIQWYRTQL
ncbi:hypothetical protein BGZ98_000780 [Dissophora globulifera]|nr:hypothetical protein BGZ98_000780 [Dissophora globulifera]